MIRALGWAIGALGASAFAAVFIGAFAMASAAHGAQERGHKLATLEATVIVAEQRQRAHLRADSARARAVDRLTEGP